jgi:hypothetical protein
MRKLALLGAAALMALTAGPVLAGTSTGQGAQKRTIGAGDGSMNCNSSTTAGNGFVILNSAGQPGNSTKVIAEVALKNATPNSMYMVTLQKDSNACGSGMAAGVLTTNEVGNGNLHLDAMETSSAGTYWVALKQGGNTVFASGAALLD